MGNIRAGQYRSGQGRFAELAAARRLDDLDREAIAAGTPEKGLLRPYIRRGFYEEWSKAPRVKEKKCRFCGLVRGKRDGSRAFFTHVQDHIGPYKYFMDTDYVKPVQWVREAK